MTKAMQQSVVVKGAAKERFELYMEAKKHAAATGARVSVSRKMGGRFSAWDGSIYGTNLANQSGSEFHSNQPRA